MMVEHDYTRARSDVPEDGVGLVRVWQAPWVSFPMVYYVAGLAMGLLALILSPAVLTSTQSGHVGGGIIFILVGLGLVSQCLAFLLFPARKVEQLASGVYRFVSPRRVLQVDPGELKWIRPIWIDPVRLLPMWAKTATGGILIAPRMHDAEGLYSGLAETNPRAGISTPTPNGWWPFRA
jgi:hypothetical protein